MIFHLSVLLGARNSALHKNLNETRRARTPNSFSGIDIVEKAITLFLGSGENAKHSPWGVRSVTCEEGHQEQKCGPLWGCRDACLLPAGICLPPTQMKIPDIPGTSPYKSIAPVPPFILHQTRKKSHYRDSLLSQQIQISMKFTSFQPSSNSSQFKLDLVLPAHAYNNTTLDHIQNNLKSCLK